ncbi:MAG: cytochrome c biogenesis protein CcsA [Actinobacteria bacterium]|nr:cytochrome c biogenesis protein CcsA [Actinomycetota bacterium]
MTRRRRVERLLGVAAVAAAAVAGWLGLVVAPPDAVQGQAQRLLYVHVPAAWVAYVAFAWVLIASVGYLIRRDLAWDRRAQAGAELGVGLTALTIVLGSLWARPIWGVWWTWDARLVTTVVLLLSYVGYAGVRGLSTDPHRNARRAAAVGILAFVNVPVVHFSVLWWRTLHQPPTVLQPASPPMDPAMLTALFGGIVAFSLAGMWVGLRRVRMLASAAPVAAAAPTRSEPIRVEAGGRR